MERTRKTDWLRTQGYRLSRLPFKVTWYTIDKVSGKEREFISRTDDYNLDLYRRKGYVLDRKYLDPRLWHELEYGVTPTVSTVERPDHSGTIPTLAKAIRWAVEERDFRQGTPSELLSLIGSDKQGMPKDATRLSMQIMKPDITNALKSYGIDVARRRTNGKRLLKLRHLVDA